jgi:fumarate hydratase, class II
METLTMRPVRGPRKIVRDARTRADVRYDGDPDGMRFLGAIAVPAEHYWGAQTQRSLTHFVIGDERMPVAVIHAYALV